MKVAFYTLGCKVNQYETQAVTEAFRTAGFEVVGDDQFSDVYVINTCSVTRMADRKSRQHIRRMKKQNPDSVILMMGCYPHTNPAETSRIEEADIILGTADKMKSLELVSKFLKEKENGLKPSKKIIASGRAEKSEETGYQELGIVTGIESRTRAMIKIQDGCDRYCSYCIIPHARGAVKSRAPEKVIEEAERLIGQGYRELVLTGINTALYGTEAGFNSSLEDLIARLCAIPGDFRIRLGSLEPTVVSSDYLKNLLKYDKLCKHVHLSVQSGSDKIISAMNRHYTREDYLTMVKTLRAFDPNYGITTDIIVGFPGESEEDFKESVSLVKEIAFLKVHVFPYSRRPYTPAAQLSNQTPVQIKKERIKRLTSVALESSLKFRLGMTGSIQKVLVEEICNKNIKDIDVYIDRYADYAEVKTAPGSVVWKGHADNFVTVYFTASLESDLSNQFVNVIIEKPFRNGVFARINE